VEELVMEDEDVVTKVIMTMTITIIIHLVEIAVVEMITMTMIVVLLHFGTLSLWLKIRFTITSLHISTTEPR